MTQLLGFSDVFFEMRLIARPTRSAPLRRRSTPSSSRRLTPARAGLPRPPAARATASRTHEAARWLLIGAAVIELAWFAVLGYLLYRLLT